MKWYLTLLFRGDPFHDLVNGAHVHCVAYFCNYYGLVIVLVCFR